LHRRPAATTAGAKVTAVAEGPRRLRLLAIDGGIDGLW
jgi:hypothetical protein